MPELSPDEVGPAAVSAVRLAAGVALPLAARLEEFAAARRDAGPPEAALEEESAAVPVAVSVVRLAAGAALPLAARLEELAAARRDAGPPEAALEESAAVPGELPDAAGPEAASAVRLAPGVASPLAARLEELAARLGTQPGTRLEALPAVVEALRREEQAAPARSCPLLKNFPASFARGQYRQQSYRLHCSPSGIPKIIRFPLALASSPMGKRMNVYF